MKAATLIKVGPAVFRIGSDWKRPIKQLQALYQDYPSPRSTIADFTVRLEARSLWRRFFRPSVQIAGDMHLPDAAPLPLTQGVLAAEMGMNVQMALGWRRHLLLHASVVARDGRAIVMTGQSGSGKSTLSALLMQRGWRFLGDEFALLDTETGQLAPFPRPVSLKNGGIEAITPLVPVARLGPELKETPKGRLRHVAPDAAALRAMDRKAQPVLLLYPRFGEPEDVRPVSKAENFVRLTQASTNYVALGEAGFRRLADFVDTTPAFAMDYPDGSTGIRLVEQLWADQL